MNGIATVTLGRRTLASQSDVEQFVSEFESHCLPKEEWTHHAHLVVGLWYVAKHPFPDAIDRSRAAIRGYNEAMGGENSESSGYHETITRFYLWYIDEHRQRCDGQTLIEALAALLNGPAVEREFPLRFYSRELLFSVEARLSWVEPDLKPLCLGATI